MPSPPAAACPTPSALTAARATPSCRRACSSTCPAPASRPTNNFAIPPNTSNATFISQLDNPNLRDPDGVDRSRWWFRIRALGTAGLSGPPVANLRKLDNQLRRFSFYTDWRTGLPLSNPQVSRLVEITAQPLTNFRNALMADKQINLSNQDVLIDSYDSSKGGYSSTTNHGQMGNIATNGQLINANYATVDGNAMTDDGNVNAGDNVTGQQSSNFYQELTPHHRRDAQPGLERRARRRVGHGHHHLHCQHRRHQPDPRAARRYQPALRRQGDQRHRPG